MFIDTLINYERDVAALLGYENTAAMRKAVSDAKSTIYNVRKTKVMYLKEHGYDLVDISQVVYGDTDHVTAVINILKMAENDKED